MDPKDHYLSGFDRLPSRDTSICIFNGISGDPNVRGLRIPLGSFPPNSPNRRLLLWLHSLHFPGYSQTTLHPRAKVTFWKLKFSRVTSWPQTFHGWNSIKILNWATWHKIPLSPPPNYLSYNKTPPYIPQVTRIQLNEEYLLINLIWLTWHLFAFARMIFNTSCLMSRWKLGNKISCKHSHTCTSDASGLTVVC